MDISNVKDLPFNLRYPEYNLLPLSSFDELDDLYDSFLRKPDYVEDPEKSRNKEYLYMVRDGRFGIFHWYKVLKIFSKHKVILKCKYDKIEKVYRNEELCYFMCTKKGITEFFDITGKKMPG